MSDMPMPTVLQSWRTQVRLWVPIILILIAISLQVCVSAIVGHLLLLFVFGLLAGQYLDAWAAHR